MRTIQTACIALLPLVSGPGLSAAEPAKLNVPPAGFAALFNGKNLDGWFGRKTQDPRKLLAMSPDELKKHKEKTRADIRRHWRVEDGVLVNDGHGLYATTNENYGDFELLVDYKTVAKADSGIYLRGIPQVQIWDYTKAGGKWKIGADKGSGGLWNNPKGAPGKDPLVLADKPFGEWSSFRIIMVGEMVTVFLNGKRVVDHARMDNYFARKEPLPPRGPIQLQTHGGEIRWRNVFIREIPPTEANDILRNGGVDKKEAGRGFRPLFNGKDFSGWTGAVDKNTIENGAILCSRGCVYTEKQFADFAVRLECKLPPGGNNGLAIRYPGTGTPAYAGMCELQVLDNTHKKYAKLDTRQYHGSAYGMVPAHRGYLREPGTWNYQEVTVTGPKITVDLNGTRILDADLSAARDFMYKPEKFKGRTRTKGHFGFAGHGDPVCFRKIEIRTLSAKAKKTGE